MAGGWRPHAPHSKPASPNRELKQLPPNPELWTRLAEALGLKPSSYEAVDRHGLTRIAILGEPTIPAELECLVELSFDPKTVPSWLPPKSSKKSPKGRHLAYCRDGIV